MVSFSESRTWPSTAEPAAAPPGAAVNEATGDACRGVAAADRAGTTTPAGAV
jgi:hypothetical protein